MSQNQNCPKCQSKYGYQDGHLWICPECFHEWSEDSVKPVATTAEIGQAQFLDVNGVPLQNGDAVITVKDLKVGRDTIKSGTKVKNIRLLDIPVDEHDISCKIDGLGSMYLKCSVVRKAK